MSDHTPICQACHAGCCRSFAVPITGADVIRLERSTGLDFWKFACRWEDREGLIAGEFAPHLFFEDEPSTPFTLCLLHEASTVYAQTTKCRFLLEGPPIASSPLGTGRCGVYENRPSACQVFPLSLSKSAQLAVLDDIPPHGRTENESDAFRLCPRPWESTDVDPIDGPQQIAVAKYESSFFKVVAALWNQRPGSWLKFPEFLRLVYEQRIVKTSAEMKDATTAEAVPLPVELPQRIAA